MAMSPGRAVAVCRLRHPLVGILQHGDPFHSCSNPSSPVSPASSPTLPSQLPVPLPLPTSSSIASSSGKLILHASADSRNHHHHHHHHHHDHHHDHHRGHQTHNEGRGMHTWKSVLQKELQEVAVSTESSSFALTENQDSDDAGTTRKESAVGREKEVEDLVISAEARQIFNQTWEKVVEKLGGIDNAQIPKEIVWLNGAPGAGKGANTPFILRTRGFQAKSIQISDLLQTEPEVAAIMKSGGLVSDELALKLLLRAILNLGNAEMPQPDADHGEGIVSVDNGGLVSGAVVDGFPRTTLQVDLVKLLYDKLMELHTEHLNTPLENHFPRPIFRIAVLYVEEEESVRRQLARGKAAVVHNQRVLDSGVGTMREVRPTDLCEKSARRRYQIFREHYDTLLRLKSFFPFHLIDSMGTLSECREQIEKELQYQSALELDATTFRAISHIPLARDIAKLARQNMVSRLDSYEKHHHDVFKEVIDIICEDVMPIIRRCALAGIAVYNTDRPLFFENPVASEMLADILSERGYAVTWQARTREIPLRVDRNTFEIVCLKQSTLQFRITFERPLIRSTEPDVSAGGLAFLQSGSNQG